MSQRLLTALPVYNEASHVGPVLAEVRRYSSDILVVNDGSNDGTADLLAAEPGIHVVTHPENRGYGAALAFGLRFRPEKQIRRAGYDRLRRSAPAALDTAASSQSARVGTWSRAAVTWPR